MFNRGVIITVTFESETAASDSDCRQSRMAKFCLYKENTEVIHNTSGFGRMQRGDWSDLPTGLASATVLVATGSLQN